MTTDHLPPQSEPACLAGLPHRVAGHCGSGALRDLLEWAGLGWGRRRAKVWPSDWAAVLGSPICGYLGSLPVYFVGRSSDLEVDLHAWVQKSRCVPPMTP